MDDLRQAVADYLAPMEAREPVDDAAQRRLEAALAALEPDGEDVPREAAVLLAELAYRACLAATDERTVDSVITVTELAAEVLASDERRWTGPGAAFETPIIDRGLAAVLVDSIELTWAQIGRWYVGEELERVQRSFTEYSEAVIAALRPG